MNNATLTNTISLSVAGGGKTTQLLNRVKNLLESGAKPEEILIISFTNSTVNNIKELTNLACYTLHSFLYRMLKLNKTIIESHEIFVKLFLKNYKHLVSLGIYQVTKLVDSYFINQNPIDSTLLNLKDYVINQEFLSLISQIQNEKENMSVCSFMDIIHQAFKNQVSLLSDIDSKFNHFLLDEAQDLSKIQLEFVYKMIDYAFCRDYKSFFIVGDPNQSIYDFQDSSELYYRRFIVEISSLCSKKDIPILVEESNTTYRFGGQILDLINEKFSINPNFPKHNSHKNQGNVFEVDPSEEEIIKILDSQGSCMVIYHTINSSVTKLQNSLCNYGYRINLWINFEELIENLRDIINYCLTGELWYKVRILQGPFYNIHEPHLELIVRRGHLEAYEKEWFYQIKKIRYPTKLLEFLAQKIVLEPYEVFLFRRLYELSHGYDTLGGLLLDLPDRLMLEEENVIKFSTIHNAKGLEHDNVIYIPSKFRRHSLFTNLNPFFFTKSPHLYKLPQPNKRKNQVYVGLTRARKNLYFYGPMAWEVIE